VNASVRVTPESAPGWYSRQQLLERFIADLLCGELRRLRPGSTQTVPQPWPPELLLDEGGFGLDSLERLSAVAALTEALHLQESGMEDLLLARRSFGEWVQITASGLQHFDKVMTFRTSGSSGAPKACAHPVAMLSQEVRFLAGLLPGARRIVFTVPCHHIYGFLFTVLLPDQLGAPELIDARRFTPQNVQHILSPGDLLVSHPAHWSILARLSVVIPAGVIGVTSTAPCPDELPEALARRGLDRLIQVYGSTETSGVGWREASGDPYRLMPFWSRDVTDHAHLSRSTPDGFVRSYPLQDRLTWVAGDRFHVEERLDDAVQVGGINVFPSEVRRKLLEHPQVADAAVRLMSRNDVVRLKAFIVTTPGVSIQSLQLELTRWIEARLPAPERPKAFTFGPELPRDEHGKLSDWDVVETCGESV
jgi:long-chain acyl-CoA synthetase